MFNGNNYFDGLTAKDWGNCYIGPYEHTKTYTNVLKNAGFNTVNPNSWHFGHSAHCFWAEYVLQYIKDNNLLNPNEIPTY
jgi:arylsulfatase A-like enzyme